MSQRLNRSFHAIEHVLTAIERAQSAVMASGTGPPAAIVLLAAARFSADEDTMTVCAPARAKVGRDFAADATTSHQ